ncbi:MAG: zinc-binding alcohol dehydrogenase family protein [Proteobacteria bacterium]|nr:zinc-binding alcohol dehydrogenase family protein [Pseudomonadota bacterium]
MKAAVLKALGSVPEYGTYAEPEVRPGEVLVHVRAAAIKQLERLIASGKHYSSPRELPIIPGLDGVGTLDNGERVYFMVQRRPFGAMAERAPASLAVPVPEALSDAVAAALVNPGLAAWLPLVERGRLRAGENVLILGATGTSGRMAVTVARQLGAGRVIACGRRRAVLEGLDADATISLDAPEAEIAAAFAAEAERGLGVVVDYLWGRPAELLIGQLARPDLHSAAGDSAVRLVSVGAMAGPDITLPSNALRGSRLELIGSGTGNFPNGEAMREAISRVFELAKAGHLPFKVTERPLEAVSDAWAPCADPDERIVLTFAARD